MNDSTVPSVAQVTRDVLPPCEICGLPARNVYPASNDRTYDLCDEHLYRLCDYIAACANERLQTKLRHIKMELQNSEVVA